MRFWAPSFRAPGQVLSALAIGVILAGPAACNGTFNLGNFFAVPDNDNPFGFLYNTDAASNVLGGLRLEDGRSVYLYGDFNPDGSVENVRAAAIRDDDGNTAGVIFNDDGFPSHAESFDGSTADFIYDEVSTSRLKGRVDLFFAQVAEPDRNQTVDFDVDLNQAAADLAAEVLELTGIEISTDAPPDQPGGKSILADRALPLTPKDFARSQLILVFVPFLQYTCAIIGYVLIEVVAKLVALIVKLVVVLVVTITKAIVIAMLTPFILMGEIMRASFSHNIFLINFNIDLDPIIIIPHEPDDDDDD